MRDSARGVATLTVLSLFGALAPAQERATMSVEAAAYLAEALAVMRQASYHRASVDWRALRRAAFEAAAGAEVPVDTYDAIRQALRALGDRHSFLQLSEELAAAELARKRERGIEVAGTEEVTRDTPSPFSERREPEGHVHDTPRGPVARVVIPLCVTRDANGHARRIQEIVARLQERGPVGWIVDLRGNGGGNMWPMLAGIGPVLGEGRIGAFADADGVTGHWYYRAGAAGVDGVRGTGFVGANVEEPLTLTALPVAVLIDKGTGSSGEATAIAFKGRPATRFFGAATYGLSTSNEGFQLGDRANLVITVGVDVDRDGNEYHRSVVPDEMVPGPESADGNDPQVVAALLWLEVKAAN